MKRSLILITFLVLSSLMIAPALAETLPQIQDQQIQSSALVYFAAADDTPSTVVAAEEAGFGKLDQQIPAASPMYLAAADETLFSVIAGDEAASSKKVKTGKNSNDGVSPAVGRTPKKQNVLMEDSAGSEKSLLGAQPKHEKISEIKALETPKTVEKPQKLSSENIPPKSANKETVQKQEKISEIKAQATPKTVENPKKLSSENISPKSANKETVQKQEKASEIKAQETPKTVESPKKLSSENIPPKSANKEAVTNEMNDINQKLQDLQKQVDFLRDLGRAREKITIGTEENKVEEEKAILTAAGREYTMMKKGKIELQYSLGYSYVSSDEIISLASSTSVVPRANHTITNAIDVQYGLRENITTGIHVPFVYIYDKNGTSSALDVSDLGDVSLNLSYQPVKSGGDWPTTTFTMGINLPTGRSPYEINSGNDLPTGGGLYGVSLGMNMSKAVDPGMLFGSISCGYSLERDGLSQYNSSNGYILEDVKPGISYSAAIGLAYSMTYSLSMNASFQYTYGGSGEYHYSTPGTDATSAAYSTGSLTIGAGYRITPFTTLSFGLTIGLTRNDPDFSFLFRLPFSI